MGKPSLKSQYRNTLSLTMQVTNHAGHGPQGLRRPIEAARLRIPSKRTPPRSRLQAPFGRASPRSRGSTSLERVSPRSRAHSPSSGSRLARGFVPPSAGARHAHGRPARVRRPRTRAFNALTRAGRHHHAPGARAPVPPHQLPREAPIPATVGRDCAVRPVSVP
jgi:hypothetical protein